MEHILAQEVRVDRRRGAVASQRGTRFQGAAAPLAPLRWSIAAVATFLVLAGTARTVEANQRLLQRAVDEYSAALESDDRNQRIQKFERAEQLFRQVIEGDAQTPPVANAQLYVNLGNAALQAERIGPAIAAYRRALQLQPDHAQARQNLDYARSLLPQWARREEVSRWLDTLFFWHAWYSREQVVLFAAICFLVGACLFAIGHAKRQPLLRNLAVFPLVAWFITATSIWLDTQTTTHHDIVVIAETTVFSADSENSSPRLSQPLPSGTELDFLQQRDRWIEVRISGGRTGWVLSSTIERIAD